MFHNYAISSSSDYIVEITGSSDNAEVQQPNGLRIQSAAKTPQLRKWWGALALAMAFCLSLSLGSRFASASSVAPYPAVDTFSGSGALSANWTNTSSYGQGYVPLAQGGGTVAPSVSGQQGLATYTGISFSNDQYAQAKFVGYSSAQGSTGVCVRMNTAGNGVCYLGDYGLLYSLANGAGNYIIASNCPVAANGDTIQLLVTGTTYTCTDISSGSSVSATDSLYSTGNPGILVDQRKSTVYALASFQADCVPSCNTNSPYPAVDTFSGSGALSTNWTNTSSYGQGYVSLAQNSGTVAPSVSGQQGLATYTGISFSNDQYAQAKFVGYSSAQGSTGVCVRMNTAGNGVCYLGDYGLLYSLANGAGNYIIASNCPVAANGDTIQLLVTGTTYTCTDISSGSSVSATDSLYSTGNPGILVDQRKSTVYALASFQADCVPSCNTNSPYPAVDTFSGSGALSTNWTNTSSYGQGYVSLAQNSGTVAPSVSGQQGLATYTGISFSNDQYAQAKFVGYSSAQGSTGVCVRMNTAGNGVCYLGDYGLLYSLANGAGNYIIASNCPVAANGDTIQLLVTGTTYTCTDISSGSSVSATDSLYSTGNPGILVDQRKSTIYALASFQADCVPSCSGGSSPTPPSTANPQLTVSVTSLSFGSVTVNTAATQSVTLSSTGTSPVTVSAAAITGSGFTIISGSLPVTLNPTQTVTLQVQFQPTATGGAAGQITISSNSTTGGTAVVALSGIGTAAAAHEVYLNWDAPSSSPDPVAGYNIYRSISSGSFQLITASPDAQTAYVDSAVASGSTYSYLVKSVDYNGVESVPSNQITVTIP
ncbi:ASPM-SPD-2-Hydin domain-containing protein [Edaphobacter aggregans]|uniref:ASPM-SPD-2-Hydin domain-containing protein n=1 Tax=Edaphobacter aggregans TaxID=570835 RepID=A0A428MK69_9BACT|nr:ASPM-SPD-2-Hydin domain-containing protein [Edaphobacter aggregans]